MYVMLYNVGFGQCHEQLPWLWMVDIITTHNNGDDLGMLGYSYPIIIYDYPDPIIIYDYPMIIPWLSHYYLIVIPLTIPAMIIPLTIPLLSR